MYTPKHYQGKGIDEAIAFIKRFNFGIITTSIDGIPIATHLPFVVSKKDNIMILTSHFAKANKQWEHICSKQNLVVFNEPHSYVSPKHYNKLENVPTWNYISIHAYGKAQIITEKKEVYKVLEDMMDNFEPEYKNQWNTLSNEYKTKMSNGIVAFQIEISDLQTKEKLSQNKKENERRSIIDSFASSDDINKVTLADYMETNELHTTKPKRH